jgi:hypothetical protein
LGDGFGEAFARIIFFGEGLGLGVGFGVGFGVALIVGVGFGVAVNVALGFGVGNWISLLAEVKSGFSSSVSSGLVCFGSTRAVAAFTDFGGGALFAPALSPAPPFSQTMLWVCAFFVSRLHRTNPTMIPTWASPISVTFRQKRASFDTVISPRLS